MGSPLSRLVADGRFHYRRFLTLRQTKGRGGGSVSQDPLGPGGGVAVEDLALHPLGLGAVALEAPGGPVNAAAARGGEGDHPLAGQGVALQEGVHDAGKIGRASCRERVLRLV